MVLRLTSSLNASQNDTGRAAFCGPTVLSAVTGLPVSRVEEEVWRVRGASPGARDRSVITGTTEEDVAAVLARLGHHMELVADYRRLERKERPTLWQWMQLPRSPWIHYLLGIHKGRTGHWIAIKGVMTCDTYTGGRWAFVTEGPHKSAKIMDAYAVRRTAVS